MSSDSTMAVVSDLHSLRNLIDQKSLRWIFVGGKGGVGKTTTSSSLAAALAAHRESVLLISTDPAHNLSDAFGQKFNKNATLVNGFSNLYCMEIDPTVEVTTSDIALGDAESKGLMQEIASSIPGIDEAMSFAELMRQVNQFNYGCIVFDTAPTGHTLRLLSFPSVLEKALDKFMQLKNKFSGLFEQVSSMVSGGSAESAEEKVFSKLASTKATIELINQQFKDPELTTFVCVCIPEFLSLYETERLVQELSKYEIDTHNIVVNQVLMVETGSNCRKCAARQKMQKKYLDQIDMLYEDFSVVKMPLLDEEVRGVEAIKLFSSFLLDPEKARLAATTPQSDANAKNTC